LANLRLRRIRVRNFKSLGDVRVELRQLNVVIGPNASGKTNFIELFLLLKELYARYVRNPVIPPYRYWWRWENVVWRGSDEPMRVEMDFESPDYEARLDVVVDYVDRLAIPYERLEVRCPSRNYYVTLEKRHGTATLTINRDYLEGLAPSEVKGLLKLAAPHAREALERVLREGSLTVRTAAESLLAPRAIFAGMVARGEGVAAINYGRDFSDRDYVLVAPGPLRRVAVRVGERQVLRFEHLLVMALRELERFFRRIVVLKPMDAQSAREPKPLRLEAELDVHLRNLANVLYTVFHRRGGRVPDRVESLIKLAYGREVHLWPKPTEDGRVMVCATEGGAELPPPCLSDSLLKLLGIGLALEQEPSVLAIDQVEDSLHAKTIEVVIDELRSLGSTTVILTTHSPAVIDLLSPEDVVLCEMTEEGTKLRRLREPEALRRRLGELGLTLSEAYIYGGLDGG